MEDYHYFVSFVSKKSNYEVGFGYCEIYGKTKIKDCKDIKEVQESIEQNNNLESATILNFKEF